MQTLQTPRLFLCYKCKGAKPENQFYKTDRVSRGVRTWCKECTLKYQRKYQRTYKRKRVPTKKNRKSQKANTIVKNAVANGFLIRPKECNISGCTGNPVGHHNDYSKPLEVTWLCQKHHMRLHKRGNIN